MGNQWTYENATATTTCSGATAVRRMRLDYVFASDVLTPVAARTDDPGWGGAEPGTIGCSPAPTCKYSDHRFVWAQVSLPAAPQPIHVGDLDGARITVKSGWRATATIRVHSAQEAPVAGVVVSGRWGNSTSTLTCTTDAFGACSMTSGQLKSESSVRLAVTGLQSPGRRTSHRPTTTRTATAPAPGSTSPGADGVVRDLIATRRRKPGSPHPRQTAMPITRKSTIAKLTPLVVLLAVLTGCGGGDDSGDGASSASAGSADSPDSPGQVAPKAGSDERERSVDPAAPGDRTSARVLPNGRDIVYRGQVTVRVRDVSRAAARAEGLVLAVDGVVFSEQTTADPRRQGFGEASLSLRVPPSQFSATLDSLGALGRELSRARSSEDVTTELADVGSRVRSQERSVARVRGLLSEADTIGEVVQVEAELARRESDLESLQAQLVRLEDVTDLATIDVTLLARSAPMPPAPDDEELGFVSGLHGGWEALVGIVLVALTVLGALFPFAVVAAVLGLPAYLLLRSRKMVRTT